MKKIFKKIFLAFISAIIFFTPLTALALTAEEKAACCCVCSDWSSTGTGGQEYCKNNIAAVDCVNTSGSAGVGAASGINCSVVNANACTGTPQQTAQDIPAAISAGAYNPVIAIDIGGFNYKSFSAPTQGTCTGQTCVSIGWMSQYFAAIYQYGVGLAAILAAIMVMVGGFVWLTSAGNSNQVSQAKEFIIGALSGLLLALFSYLILFTINPALIQNQATGLVMPTAINPTPSIDPSVKAYMTDYDNSINRQCQVNDKTCNSAETNVVSVKDSNDNVIGTTFDLQASGEMSKQIRGGTKMTDEIPFFPESKGCSSSGQCYYYEGVYYVLDNNNNWHCFRKFGM